MKQTELQFKFWQDNVNLISMELDCTIPLNIGDVMIYTYEDFAYHLKVEKRLYVPSINTLTIVFEQTNKYEKPNKSINNGTV
jgi:hypothetical protein